MVSDLWNKVIFPNRIMDNGHPYMRDQCSEAFDGEPSGKRSIEDALSLKLDGMRLSFDCSMT
jgi:hypothetical protein